MRNRAMLKPYYQDDQITLYHGDATQMLNVIPEADAIITDPPYNETSLEWDKWPDGWPQLAENIAPQLWCFGSMRMFLDKCNQFSGWKMAQDIIWEKHNGSNSANDRFRRIHEIALHFYQGEWRTLHRETQYTNDATARTVRRKKRPPQWGKIGESHYESKDGGPRLMGSVIYAKSCHGYAVNETQKPESIIIPLIEYSVPKNGLVVDFFAGSGTTGVVARKTGRRAILVEKRETQCQEIVSRLAQGDLLAS